MSELVRDNLEYYSTISVDDIHEIFGDNGDKLAPACMVLDRNLEADKAQDWVLEKLAEAKTADKLTALVAGAFDVPHPNHDWFLRHCRLLLAEKFLKYNDIDIDQIDDKNTKNSLLREVVDSDKYIYLVTSIDSDAALDIRKSNDASKGGVKRPIYDWNVRANRIASYNFASQADPRQRFSTVDLVIAEGPEYDGTMLHRAKHFANIAKNDYGLIDEYVVFDEHQSDIDNAKQYGFDPIIIPMDYIYAKDPSGRGYKSSKYIKKIRGEDA